MVKLIDITTAGKFQDFSTAFQGPSRPGILFFKFKDFRGFSRTVGTLFQESLCTVSSFHQVKFASESLAAFVTANSIHIYILFMLYLHNE